MVARESVRARIGTGLSFTEFSYQVLQAYDFLALHERYGCTIQMGGSDQWGNITVGTELIRKVRGADAFGLTLPLVTKSDGSKFGKTESGTVWLDPARTSAYEMYQFWLNTPDADVVRFLKTFTFLTLEEIDALGRRAAEAPEQREAQRALAREATRLVHGEEGLREAEARTAALFGGGASATGKPDAELPAPAPVWRVLKDAGFVSSTSEARRLLQQGGVEVDQRRAGVGDVLEAGAHTIKLGKRRIYYVVMRD
jgi:tyrosyl-tRNA synthetase